MASTRSLMMSESAGFLPLREAVIYDSEKGKRSVESLKNHRRGSNIASCACNVLELSFTGMYYRR